VTNSDQAQVYVDFDRLDVEALNQVAATLEAGVANDDLQGHEVEHLLTSFIGSGLQRATNAMAALIKVAVTLAIRAALDETMATAIAEGEIPEREQAMIDVRQKALERMRAAVAECASAPD
jgi:hypothetical protein